MRRSTGFSLVEALVALVVISFGLLGVATMQLKALEGAHVGYRHSLVSLMAIDAQERVWKSLTENSGSCPEGTADGTALKDINNAWLGYWFDEASLGFTDSNDPSGRNDPDYASEIRLDVPEGTICQYRVLVSWETLLYSIFDEENDDGGSRTFEYVFRVPNVSEQ